MAYIIGTYNKYDQWDRSHSVQRFVLNDVLYAIYEVEMVWGLPALKYSVDNDDRADMYCVYERLEDAQAFIRQLKRFNH